ncbi:MAG: hypothetical protein UW73_C0019G0003 [Microgenomates group bacterium GW2011_GWB1_44_8]|nr:MAG: hypothetical protein UW73_C0019G0003 [Microgenomates group bacterium GW2011_GWB1_44_8]
MRGSVTVARRSLKAIILVRIQAPQHGFMWFVYILLCNDESYYIGSSNDVEKRFKEHLDGKGGRYTRSHKPVKLVYKEELANKSEALKREAELKKLTRIKKQALVGRSSI